MNDPTALARAFDLQAGACVAFGSPFSGALLTLARQDIEGGGPLADLLAPWAAASTRSLMGDAVPLRWLGAVHDLVLSGEAPAVAAAYPGPAKAGDARLAWTAARQEMIGRPDHFVRFMTDEPQTNEVRRSACLLPGFLTVAGETGLPLRIFEIGASAGLNQLWDRFAYGFGEAGAWGDAASRVKLDAEWRGVPGPFATSATVVSRAACDRKPVDIRDPTARRRLKAYVWADQFDRLARLDAALAMNLEADTRVGAEDALNWVPGNAMPAPGAATVIFHSVFWQYLPVDTQAALTQVIVRLGARATTEAPLAWLRMEPMPTNLADVELRLTVWPEGEERLLAHVHPHGAWVDWVGG
jgi:hypothetical protein